MKSVCIFGGSLFEVENQSMKRFAGVIARATGNAMLTRVTFSDWMDLFTEVSDSDFYNSYTLFQANIAG